MYECVLQSECLRYMIIVRPDVGGLSEVNLSNEILPGVQC